MLPIRRYEGPIHVIGTPEELDRARREIENESVVGFDTETRPAFRKGEVYPPSLIQAATRNGVYLFLLKRLNYARAVTEFLENPNIVKAGIGLRDDFAKLRMKFELAEQSAVELSAVAKKQGVTQPSVRTLTGLFLGFRVPKGQSTSNWARVELTEQQILYAATDAWVCRELYLCFQERGFLDSIELPSERS